MAKKGAELLAEAIATTKINCKHCRKTMTVHAIGHNKQTMNKFKTGKDVVSMACWTKGCPEYGKEVQRVWEH